MDVKFDEIDLRYWNDNKEKLGASKSYVCTHNGYTYGDAMDWKRIEFIHRTVDSEEILAGKNDGPKGAYFALVEKACNLSEETFENFKNNGAEKFRIYSKAQVAAMSHTKRNSTRIKDDSCKIIISGEEYYVANNLKICEYFNSAAINIESTDLTNWLIRVYFDSESLRSMIDTEEAEPVQGQCQSYNLKLRHTFDLEAYTRHHSDRRTVAVKVDFESVGKRKKKIGDLGEELIMRYEKDMLVEEGREDLAKKIEHTARVKGDGIGYDITSFTPDGRIKYIEVKTTKQNTPDEFYLSRNEKAVADEMFQDGKLYLIYRIYNLDVTTGNGDLMIFESPFDEERYSLKPENWKVSYKRG